jgi:cellulose synthase/poly-beta-1,6-N-acetylglucosamine synthase-like glycosyltransferase
MHASILVPAYNASATIERCLMALLKQRNIPSFEIIVIDDGSQDATPDIVSRFSQVRLIRSSHSGAAAARNRGARDARGDILLFTDADCEPQPDWACAMLAPFVDSSIVATKGIYRTRQKELVARFVQLEYEEKYARMRGEQTIDHVDTYSAGYRREVFLSNNGFDESFPSAAVEDQEFSFRLAKQGYCMVFAPEAIVNHQHVTTLKAYAKRKFRIGYWKVHTHHRHPDKMWRDSHTPPTIKLEIIFFYGILASLLASLLFPPSLIATLVCLIGFIASALPLLRFISRRDSQVARVALGMIAVRAAALGTGLMIGVVREMWISITHKAAYSGAK